MATWITLKGHSGIQYREYDGVKTYRLRHGKNPTKIDYFGVMSEVEVIHIVASLKKNRALGIGPQSYSDMQKDNTEELKAQNIAETKERKRLIAEDQFERTNTLETFFDNVYWPMCSQKGNAHSNNSTHGLFNNHVRPHIGDVSLINLKFSDIENTLNIARSKKLKPQTIKHIYSIIQATYNYAVVYFSAHNSIALSPFPGKILKLEKLNNEKTCWLEYDEAKCLLDALYNWRKICAPHKLYFKGNDTKDAYGMAVLALFCGLRFGDIANLKWRDVETAYAYARNPKSGKAYGIHLDIDVVREMIEERRTFYPKATADDYVFLSRVGKKWIKVPEIFFDVIEELQFNYNQRRINNDLETIDFHALRHTFASWLAIRGTNLHEIMTLMGHGSIQMTLRYARLNPEYTKRHVAELAKEFNSVSDNNNKKAIDN